MAVSGLSPLKWGRSIGFVLCSSKHAHGDAGRSLPDKIHVASPAAVERSDHRRAVVSNPLGRGAAGSVSDTALVERLIVRIME